MPEISIIIRTKNEEKWIGHCLGMLEKQTFKDFEIILVDNESTDYTVEVAKRYNLAKIINIGIFRPGNAINEGIRASTGKYIVCLSAHCVPKNTDWLSILRHNFDIEKNIAGVYGRQVPVSFTDAVDKRDLLIVFGQDRRLQVKDYFFHNANSMFRRDVWLKYPFDEEVTNIEDRVWGKAIIEAGYHIVYDPDAAVFHHHGLHQGNAPKRVKGVVSIIEQVDKDIVSELPESLHPKHAHIAAVLPILGDIVKNSIQEKLIISVVKQLKNAMYVDTIYLVSDSYELSEMLDVNLIGRSKLTNINSVSIDELMRMALLEIEATFVYPEALLYVNYDYPFRPLELFDDLILDAQFKGYDTAFPGLVDYGHYWFRNDDNEFKQTDISLKSRAEREPVYRALYGLGCVSSSSLIRTGRIVGGKIGILPIKDQTNALRIKDFKSEKMFETFVTNKEMILEEI
jgi:rhamnosyltransferase